MITDLKCLIKTYDNVIPSSMCKSLIEKYEANIDNIDKRHNQFFNFNEILLQKYPETFEEEFKYAFDAFNECVVDYVNSLEIAFWPPKYGYEMFRLKKYPLDGYFVEHIDVTGESTMKRFLSFFCYLNNAGGTRFTHLDYEVESKEGRLLLFPPMWMFPHEAIVSNKENKFLLHTYLHYI